jgi:glycosyltransferase involved in cell wall biosynthesis
MRFGFVGSLMVAKAPHVLIEACAGLAAGSWEAHLFGDHADYHGDASYRGRLAPLLKRSGVFHHGMIARERVRAALAGIDVLVVPSIWPENSPLVVLEAFLAGIPVVASLSAACAARPPLPVQE